MTDAERCERVCRVETTAVQIRLVVDIATGHQPLAGTLLAGDETIEFRGWLELAAAIERARWTIAERRSEPQQ